MGKAQSGARIPVWESDLCIQCGKCVFVCPHAVIRHKIYDKKFLEKAPVTFKHMDSKFKVVQETLLI
jgi:pyruvate-ferredoxin/flavodoxin oxidoreductase